MKIEDIFALWENDSTIDKTEISEEGVKVSKLHHKYYSIYFNEKVLLRKLEINLKKLRFEKFEFYTQGPNEETQSKGWRLPPKGAILKTDANMYIDADDDIINLTLRIGLQTEKVEALDSILKIINNRGYILKTCLDWHKFTHGVNT